MRDSMKISFPPFLTAPLRELMLRLRLQGTSLSMELRPKLLQLLRREGIEVPKPGSESRTRVGFSAPSEPV